MILDLNDAIIIFSFGTVSAVLVSMVMFIKFHINLVLINSTTIDSLEKKIPPASDEVF